MMTSIDARVTRLPHAQGMKLPLYQTTGAAAMDLAAALPDGEELRLEPSSRALVPTGLMVAVPSDHELQIRPRSGLALRHGVTVLNSPGTIDSDYRGEVKVLLINLGSETFVVRRGDRIAQALLAPVTRCVWQEVDGLDQTVRGEGGFGST